MKLPNRRVWLATALYATGFVHACAWFRRMAARGGPIYLMGHRVVPADAASDPVDRMALLSGHAITPAELERRLAWVQQWVMPAGDPADLRSGPPARRAFYLTFDDGYADNVTHAAPVLDRLGIRAIIFFVADVLRHPTSAPWWDRWGADALAGTSADNRAVAQYGQRCGQAKKTFRGLESDDLLPTQQRRYLTKEELARLPDTFYPANHTRSHANLTALDYQQIQVHIDEGRIALSWHPRYLPLLAFPFGSHDERVLAFLKRAGQHAMAFATGGGVDGDRWRARRINLNVAPFPLFAAQCAGLLK